MRQSTPPGECKKETPSSGVGQSGPPPGLDSGGQQIQQGAGSIPVVGGNLQQGANQATSSSQSQSGSQVPPVPAVG